MKDLSQISSENLRQVSAPLQMDQIKEFFDNKELFFLIDYSQSKIKGNMFLTYISNLDLPCEILLEDSSKEDKFDLIRFYFETRNINNSNVLRLIASQIMLEYRGIDTTPVFINPQLTREECLEFIASNKEMIEKWHLFILSSQLYFLTSVQEVEEHYNFKSLFKTIDDPQYIGSNVVQLFSVASFLELYLSIPSDRELVYFKQQFEEYMFRGKNFFEYFMCPQNSLYLTLNNLLDSNMDLSLLSKVMQRE